MGKMCRVCGPLVCETPTEKPIMSSEWIALLERCRDNADYFTEVVSVWYKVGRCLPQEVDNAIQFLKSIGHDSAADLLDTKRNLFDFVVSTARHQFVHKFNSNADAFVADLKAGYRSHQYKKIYIEGATRALRVLNMDDYAESLCRVLL